MNTKAQLFLDRISIGISTLCAIHCAVLPLLLVLSPNLVLGGLDDHYFHLVLVWLVLPASLLAGLLGCSKHKDTRVISGIAVGLGSLVLTALWGHDFLGEFGEKAVTFAATIVLGLSHWRNFKLCKESSCNSCNNG